MQITTEELRKIFDALLAHIEADGHSTVDLPHDYYWTIFEDDLYNPYQRPQELGLGQLSDDWNELLRIARGEAEPLAFAFIWLAPILRALGEEIMS